MNIYSYIWRILRHRMSVSMNGESERKKSIFRCCRSCWVVVDLLKTKMERNTICEYSANNGTKSTQFNKGKSTWSALHWRCDGVMEMMNTISDFILSSIGSYQNEELHNFQFCPQTYLHIYFSGTFNIGICRRMDPITRRPNQNERCSKSMFEFDLITEWRKRRSRNSAL